MGKSCIRKKLVITMISILKDTNRVVASSDIDLGNVRPGSLFRVIGDSVFYTVAKTNRFFLIKDFEFISSRRIKVTGDVNISLSVGDTLSISYKEWELYTIMEILNPGKGYKVGDEISASGGDLSVDAYSGTSEACLMTVDGIDDNGGITNIGLHRVGRYVSAPNKKNNIIGGSGDGAVFDLDFRLLEDRKIVERTIVGLDTQAILSDIFLDYPIPNGIKDGKVSVKKWEILLSSNYVEDSKVNVNYDISNDFTPVFNLPLLVPGSFSMELIYNQTIRALESEILKNRTEIEQLKKLLSVK